MSKKTKTTKHFTFGAPPRREPDEPNARLGLMILLTETLDAWWSAANFRERLAFVDMARQAGMPDAELVEAMISVRTTD